MSRALKYDLASLEWQQFEELASKCLMRDISPSLRFVEGGKDKGRDFLFSGATDFFSKDGHEGSYVFQAKHKTGKDAFSALKSDLGAELRKVYLENGLRYDHYCLVTNLTLTGTENDLLEQVCAEFAVTNAELPPFSFHIYSYRHLENCLDRNKGIQYDFPRILSRSSFAEMLAEVLDRPGTEASRVWRSVFERNQYRFVHTKAYGDALDKLLTDGLVLLSGPPRAGKTFNAYALILRLAGEFGFIPYQIASVEEFKRDYRSDRKQVFLFDDAFGRHHLDILRADELDRSLEYVIASIDVNHKCILTSREHVYRGFADLAQVDVTKVIARIEISVASLTQGEKDSLFVRYLSEADGSDVVLDTVVFDEITAHENFSPEILRAYFDEHTCFELNEFRNHLREPDAYLGKVFSNLPEEHKLILLSVLFAPRPDKNCIAHSFKLLCQDRNHEPLIELGKELHLLTDSIVRKDADMYSFYHPSMCEYFVRLLSNDLVIFRGLMLRNLNVDLLQLVGFTSDSQTTGRVALEAKDLDEAADGLSRLVAHPYSTLIDVNSMFEWFSRDDVQLALKVRLKDDYRRMMRNVLDQVQRQPLSRYVRESSTQLAMFLEHMAGLQQLASRPYELDTEVLLAHIGSRKTDDDLWRIVFASTVLLGESKSLSVIGRDWFNQFYVSTKAEIDYLGEQLYGNAYPDFAVVKAYQEALASDNPETRRKAQKKSRSDYMLKTPKVWYPRFKKVREKMYRLKGAGPLGRRIHDKLLERFSHLAALQDHEQNRFVFLKEKKYW